VHSHLNLSNGHVCPCGGRHYLSIEEFYETNSSHKIGFIKEDWSFFINMSKILSTCNIRLFLNTISHVQINLFPSPCHGVSSVGAIHLVIGSNTMKKFVGLTHLIKLVL
jgi:hypothetical protein